MILVVEDNNLLQFILQTQLKHLGYSSDIAGDGQTALKLIQEKNYDLIFMDFCLPDINGLQVAAQISKSMTIPIIGITADYFEMTKANYPQYGIRDVMLKPFSIGALQEILNQWLTK